MKRYCFYACLLGIAFMNQSCKDFLDIEPKSKGIAIANNASDSIIYKSGSEAEAALGGVYADFKNEYYQLDYFVNGEAQSDNAYAGGDNPDNFQIDEFRLDATNRNVSRDWAYLYATIGKANSVINNVPKVTDTRLTAERRKEIIAEAAFIRAFMYFQLVQLWGDVPLQLKDVKTISAATLPEVYPLLFPARAPAADIYKQIILDLETALQGVKAKGIDKGFITKGAVNAVFAKVYATQEPRDWAKVKKYSDDVISGGYALLTNYDFLWDNAHENSDEAIWEINYNGGITDGNWGTMIFRGLDWKKFNLPANDLIRAFDAENDRIRKAATVVFLDVTGKWSDRQYPQTQYPFNNKTRVYTEGSNQNNIFIRLADIILLKAEAVNELGDAAAAATLVNQIRTRVNLPATSATSQADMRLAIEKERRLELAFEAHRWYDLKRTGRAIDVMTAAKGANSVSLGYILNKNKLFWPIPQAELDKNVKLKQNAGY